MKTEIDYRNNTERGMSQGLVGIRLRSETPEESQIMELLDGKEVVMKKISDCGGKATYHWLIQPKEPLCKILT